MTLGNLDVSASVINVDAACTLIDAITAANSDTATGGCPAGSASDTIVLPAGSIQTLTNVNNVVASGFGYGPNGLPVVSSEITIQGNNSVIQRSMDPGTPEFRIMATDVSGDITLQDTTLSGGDTGNYSNGGGGVLNQGTLTLTNSTVSDNSSSGSRGRVVFSTPEHHYLLTPQ